MWSNFVFGINSGSGDSEILTPLANTCSKCCCMILQFCRGLERSTVILLPHTGQCCWKSVSLGVGYPSMSSSSIAEVQYLHVISEEKSAGCRGIQHSKWHCRQEEVKSDGFRCSLVTEGIWNLFLYLMMAAVVFAKTLVEWKGGFLWL